MAASRRLRLLSAFAAALVAGCAVGPDFLRPDAPQAERFTHTPLPAATASAPGTGGAAQRFLAARDIPGEWWTLFHSPALNALVAKAFEANPTLAAAEATLRQAHELTLAGRGAFFPTALVGLGASRNKTASSLSPATFSGNFYYSLYTTQLSVGFVPDVFGGIRRQVEALAAQEENQLFQLEAAYLTLTANLVAAAVTEAALRGQIAATEEIIAIARKTLDILRRQQALGQVTGADVAAQEAALAQVEATLPPLRKQLAQQRHLLAVLTGSLPSEGTAAEFDLASLELPRELPVSLPSRLVEQRPDIRAAEAQLHAASATIGVAVAARLPQITLTANPGLADIALGHLLRPGAPFWSFAGNAAQTIFDAGTLRHKQRAAEAAYDAAAAQYRATVLTAFQNVADSLRALTTDADGLQAIAASERAAATNLEIARRQLATGAIAPLAVLVAEQTYQQSRIALAVARAARLADSAALFQALGGGWWNRDDVKTAAAARGEKP